MSIPPPGETPPIAPFCPRCGAPNEAKLAQCPHCGQSLLAAWPPAAGRLRARPRPTPPQTTIGGFGGMIPDKNPSALTAYYLGIFSIIPCLAIPMGLAAVVLGLRGLALVKERPEVRGRTHAWVGIISGGLFGLINIIGLIAVVVTALAARASVQP